VGNPRTAGALWVAAGLICAGLFVTVFVGENLADPGALLRDPWLPALILGGAIVGLLTGSLLITRPGPMAVRWSTIAGVAWLVAFGALALTALDGPDYGPLLSSGLITGFGVAGAVVGYSSRRTPRSG
jgi:ABC-type Fe3+-siderophore transport system permease subunit